MQNRKIENYKIMKKEILIILVYSCCFASLTNAQGSASLSKGEVFLITEAYEISNGNSRSLKEFVDTSTYITILTINDSAFVIGIDHGSVENTILFGKANKTENTGFTEKRDDAEFFKWFYISNIEPKGNEALVFKEYLTGSFEESNAKYYFFNIVFHDMSQFQIYGRLLEEPKNK